MKWISALQKSESLESAFQKMIVDLKKKLGRSKADLGLVFISHEYREEIVDLWSTFRKAVPVKNLLGCTAGGVIGGDHEVEDQAAVSLTAAILPKVKIHLFHVHQDQLPDSDGSPRPWRDLIKAPDGETPKFIILSDPFSIDSSQLVEGLDFAYPNSIKTGGLASGGTAQNENLLLLNERLFHQGAIGAALSGDISIEPLVAQGCRPIGDPLKITSCQDNVLMEVNNTSPLQYLSNLFQNLSKRDQELLSHSLFLGILMDPFLKNPKQGDFLIRNIIGMDQEKGILAIGAILREGQTIQFHLRDAHTSHDDLKLLLSKSEAAESKNKHQKSPSQAGAVLFSCVGRGKNLYGKTDHDISLVKSLVGNIPIGGFFCNGEIGPVSGKTYLHGYTSSIAFFRPKSK